MFAKANLSFGLDDHFADNAAFLANAGDFLAVPEFESYSILHHRPGVARFNSIMLDDKGQVWEGCPRSQLKKITEEFHKLKITIKLSFEPEFSIYKKENENLIPISFDGMFTISGIDRKSTRLNSSHALISYAVFCLKKKKTNTHTHKQKQTQQQQQQKKNKNKHRW